MGLVRLLKLNNTFSKGFHVLAQNSVNALFQLMCCKHAIQYFFGRQNGCYWRRVVSLEFSGWVVSRHVLVCVPQALPLVLLPKWLNLKTARSLFYLEDLSQLERSSFAGVVEDFCNALKRYKSDVCGEAGFKIDARHVNLCQATYFDFV